MPITTVSPEQILRATLIDLERILDEKDREITQLKERLEELENYKEGIWD